MRRRRALGRRGLTNVRRSTTDARRDVVRLRCYTRPIGDTRAICAGLALANGSEVEFREEIPGWDRFLDAAAGVLPGVRARLADLPQLARDDALELLLYERRALG